MEMENVMKTLEEIFQTHFNCPEPFDKNGDLTEQGESARKKLVSLVIDLESRGLISGAKRIEDAVDEIIDHNNY